ncbi:MAG: transketolase C-terminal domain-containing protein [Bacteroidales bacterium]
MTISNNIPCRQAFTETLIAEAENDKNIIVVTTDARGSVTLGEFARRLPEQFVELGIAEQNGIGVSAGLALSGKNVFVCGPACFYSARSLEQVKTDVAYSGAPVKIIGVSGGVSYGILGATHQSLHDIAVMRALPNLTVILPCDIHQTRLMTKELIRYRHPVYVRMGRGAVPEVYNERNATFTTGRANILMDGKDLTLIGCGETVYHCLQAGNMLRNEGISARVIDMHTLKPLDVEVIRKSVKDTSGIITAEEHSINGGLGAAVAAEVVQYRPIPMKIIGFPDEFLVHGTSAQLFDYYGLTSSNIIKEARKLLHI